MKVTLREPFKWWFNSRMCRYELVVRPGEPTEEIVLFIALDIMENEGDSPEIRNFFVKRLMQ